MPPSFAEQSEQNFRDNVRQYREQAGLTQAELAQRLSEEGFAFHAQTIYKIERGERQLRLNEAVALARALGVELEILIDDPEANSISTLRLHVDDAASNLESAIFAYQNAQATLAMFADALEIDTEDDENHSIPNLLTRTVKDVYDDYELRYKLKMQSIEEYLDTMEKERPGEIGSDVRDQIRGEKSQDGPFVLMWKESRGEHQAKA